MNSEINESDRLDRAKYKVGDRVKVNDNSCQIIEVDHLQLSDQYLYVVSYDNVPIVNTIVTESEIHD